LQNEFGKVTSRPSPQQRNSVIPEKLGFFTARDITPKSQVFEASPKCKKEQKSMDHSQKMKEFGRNDPQPS
jgi:hypothetical protein